MDSYAKLQAPKSLPFWARNKVWDLCKMASYIKHEGYNQCDSERETGANRWWQTACCYLVPNSNDSWNILSKNITFLPVAWRFERVFTSKPLQYLVMWFLILLHHDVPLLEPNLTKSNTNKVPTLITYLINDSSFIIHHSSFIKCMDLR